MTVPIAKNLFRSRSAGMAMLGAAMLFVSSGCQSTPQAPTDFAARVVRFYLEAPAEAPAATQVELPVSRTQIPVYPREVLRPDDVANVELVQVDLGLCLMFEFTYEGARTLLRLSGSNLGRRLLLTINDKPFGARVFDGPINDGRLFIFVEIPDEELRTEVVNLKRTAQEIQAAIARRQGNAVGAR